MAKKAPNSSTLVAVVNIKLLQPPLTDRTATILLLKQFLYSGSTDSVHRATNGKANPIWIALPVLSLLGEYSRPIPLVVGHALLSPVLKGLRNGTQANPPKLGTFENFDEQVLIE